MLGRSILLRRRESGDPKKDIMEALARAGFQVAEAQPEAPMPGVRWVLDVSTPPPLQVRLRVTMLQDNLVVLGIGVQLSEEHRSKVSSLPPGERVSFTAEVLEKLLLLCPECRAVVQPSLDDPQAFAAEVRLLAEEATPQRVVDEATKLVNVFIMVNLELWRRWPAVAPGGSTGQQVFM